MNFQAIGSNAHTISYLQTIKDTVMMTETVLLTMNCNLLDVFVGAFLQIRLEISDDVTEYAVPIINKSEAPT